MPPLNRDLPLIAVEDENGQRHFSSRGTTHRQPCPSPTGSCMSLNAVDHFKFSSRPQNHQIGQKRVTFQTDKELQEVKFVEPPCEWSEEERCSRWHSQEDYENFRRDVFHTLYLLRNRLEDLDGVSYTARGIQCRDPAVIGKRQHIKQMAWQSVFDEQVAMRKNSSDDLSGQNDWMATTYSNVAHPALREALDSAALDEEEAKQIHNEESATEAQEDPFSDDWIRSISSHSASEDLSFVASKHEDDIEDDGSGFCVFGEDTGFDDDWIRGD